MGQPIAKFRLSDEPRDFGLSCSAQGLTLAGVPLLKRTDAGFQPRSVHEIGRLIGSAYRTDADVSGLMSALDAVANALNEGAMARAMIAAVLLKLPELDWGGAVRIAQTEDVLDKAGFNPGERRDPLGRWTSSGTIVGRPANDHLGLPGRPRERLPLLPSSSAADDADLLEIADNSSFHNEVQRGLVEDFRAHGLIAETEVKLTFVGSAITASADNLVMVPGYPTSLTVVEVKTGPSSRTEGDQVWIYPGFAPGQPLPAGHGFIWHEKHPGTPSSSSRLNRSFHFSGMRRHDDLRKVSAIPIRPGWRHCRLFFRCT